MCARDERIKRMLVEAEKSLFNNDLLADKDWVNYVIHDGFREVTDTGRLIFKDEVLQKMGHCHTKLELVPNNVEYVQVSENSWLLYYIIDTGEAKEYHTSLWIKSDIPFADLSDIDIDESDNNEYQYFKDLNTMKVVFHQISIVQTPVNLIPFE
ncbi:hypothetical protein HCQ94_03480 [Actinomyces sp. zg-332]|uniref:hypothetical protein n=1 Tax=Actinomyces sp. zg-332 TaxID=2708340 RepID=UPI001423C1DB|nr:hypothetical protein [Actinomyces sp. zg-332]QPK93668.1 hypothetical protein HCQ94_03480 [Actinomyces sp. zg-332]